MNTIELYEFPELKGKSKALHDDITDLMNIGFNQKAQSLRVSGEPWIVFIGKNYEGEFYVFKEGIYSTIPSVTKQICSVRVVHGGLYNPKITIYDQTCFNGRSVTIEGAEDSLKPYGMENNVLSYTMEKGAWIMYDGEYYTGGHKIALAGDKNANSGICGSDTKIKSLKPIQEYQTAN
ncbi:epidermal differentiation-specific protein-like [Rhinophrynus dorsalis]